jgi:hypothetical protein
MRLEQSIQIRISVKRNNNVSSGSSELLNNPYNINQVKINREPC